MYLTRAECRSYAGDLLLLGNPTAEVGPELRELLREVKPLGLVLFDRNLGQAGANIEMCRELRSLQPRSPLLLAVDQEGGKVARLRDGMSVWPPMAALGALHANDAELGRRVAFDVGAALGHEVRAIGFDVNFAPVLDVHTNPKNPIIGDRALSHDPHVAAALAEALIRGLQGAGVAACGKHFPGHGDTDTDSHHTLPEVHHDLRRLREVEWPPFVAAIAAGVSSIMTGHVRVPELDNLPATLSPYLIEKILRQEMGYRGIVIADDVSMKGLRDNRAMADIGPAALGAGIDVLIACHEPDDMLQLYRGLVLAAEKQTLPHAMLKERAARARAWRDRWIKPLPTVREAHANLNRAFERHAPLVRMVQDAARTAGLA